MQAKIDADRSPRETAEALLAQGREYTTRSEFAPAQECFVQALALSRRIGDPGLEADSLIRLGTVQYSLSDHPAALSYYRQAQVCLQGRDDPVRTANAAIGVGIVYYCLGDFGSALTSYAEALTLSRSVGDPESLCRVLNNVGGVHAMMGDFAGALCNYEEGLEISRTSGNLSVEAYCLGGIAHANSELGRHPEAVAASRTAFEAARLAGSPFYECGMLLSWADCLIKAGQNEEALPLYTQALTLARSFSDFNSECAALIMIGEAALATGDWEKTQTHLCRAAEIAEHLKHKPFGLQACRGLSKASEQQGDLAAALTHYQRFHLLEREVYNEDADKRTKSLMIQMGVERSQQEAEIHRLRNVELVEANTALEEAGRRLQEQAELLEMQAEELRAQNEELLSQSEALERQASEDGLTGLANRRHLEAWLALLFHKARQDGTALAVVMADVDHFKQVNDRFGHQIGDEVLMTVALLFRQSCRATDLAARYGGEEFVLVLPDTDASQAAILCERLRAEVESYDWQTVHPDLAVTLSLGLSDDCDVSSHEHLLGLADAQLYAAKQAGRNRVSFTQFALSLTDVTRR